MFLEIVEKKVEHKRKTEILLKKYDDEKKNKEIESKLAERRKTVRKFKHDNISSSRSEMESVSLSSSSSQFSL